MGFFRRTRAAIVAPAAAQAAALQESSAHIGSSSFRRIGSSFRIGSFRIGSSFREQPGSKSDRMRRSGCTKMMMVAAATSGEDESEEEYYDSCSYTSKFIPNATGAEAAAAASDRENSTPTKKRDATDPPPIISHMLVLRKPSNSKPHCKAANDMGWEAIQELRDRDGAVGLNHFKLIRRLGCGDIGSVYLCELRGTSCYFAMKVMDKGALAIRKKLSRAQTEKEILASLDHPFLPTLYAHFETSQFSCLVMEYCSGGDLHSLRQQQPGKCFNDMATKFYAAEVLLALEYLHMMGVVYRDLKPENVLVREDGHIMLSDFDLSLRCVVSPMLMFPAVITSIESSSSSSSSSSRNSQQQWKSIDGFTSLEQPNALDIQSCVPMMMSHKFLHSAIRKKPSFSSSVQEKGVSPRGGGGGGTTTTTTRRRPELVVEPTEVRSMSFVGTHEYLAPEIISGDGHGSSVDWWTFGIFLYELLYSRTPFKGVDNELTLTKVVSHPLLFPASNATANRVPESAKDLIRGLLVKNPMKRLGSLRGAGEIKSHSYFEGVNWALIRCTVPPQIPKPYKPTEMMAATTTTTAAGATKSQLQPAAGAAAEAQKENQKANGWRKQESDVSHVVPPHFQYF